MKLRTAEHTIKELRGMVRQLEASSKASASASASSTAAGGGRGGAADEKAVAEAVEKAKVALERKWKKGERAITPPN